MTSTLPEFESALLLNGSGGARELSADEVGKWSAADGVLWLDCDQRKKQIQQWLENPANVGENVADILLAGETRPRAIVENNGLIVVLRGINMHSGAEPDDMIAVRIWLEENRIITSHRRKTFSVEDVRDSLKSGRGPGSPGEFLISLTGFLSKRISAAVENIEDLIDGLESNVAVGNVQDMRTSLGIIRRQAAAIRRYLAPQRDALDQLTRTGSIILSTTEIFDLREAGDQILRQVEDLDLARENALVTQEELMNRIAQEQNARMYLLSIVSAVFLPLMFVTGLLGMNVAGLPGTENPRGFVYAAIIMGVFGVGMAIYFKLRKWI